MEFITPKSKVYIQTDAQNRITRCEGGYTTPSDLTGWLEFDGGYGDRFNLCQSHYFDGGLYTMDGICRYKYVGGMEAIRDDSEIAADRAAIPEPEPTAETDLLNMTIDHEYRLTLLEVGGVTDAI